MTMSFPPSYDRDAMRRALHASLSDVLREVGADGASLPHSLTGGARPFLGAVQGTTNPSSMLMGRREGTFDAPLLPSRSQTLFTQSLGLPYGAAPGASSTGMHQTSPSVANADNLLVSAAAAAMTAAANEEKILEQARAVLLRRQITEESNRMFQTSQRLAQAKEHILKSSYASLFQGNNLATLHAALPAALAEAVPPLPPHVSTVQDDSPKKGSTALEALGSNLRKKTDPYIDVSQLRGSSEDDAQRRTRGGVSEPFPEKLHRMLKEVEEEGNSDVVSFFSHGRAFGVHDMDRFTEEIMPKYFKQTKWNSFARQLNLYGFLRITSGPDAGGYYHELFLKGRPNLCVHMRRVGVPKGEDRRKLRTKNSTMDPDFYSMKAVVEEGSLVNTSTA